jgi:hypothetical protein
MQVLTSFKNNSQVAGATAQVSQWWPSRNPIVTYHSRSCCVVTVVFRDKEGVGVGGGGT